MCGFKTDVQVCGTDEEMIIFWLTGMKRLERQKFNK